MKVLIALSAQLALGLGCWAAEGAGVGIGGPIGMMTTPPDDFGAQPTPQMALQSYIEVLQRHIKDPNLGLYTPDTRAMLRQWRVTDAQQIQELRKLQKLKTTGEIFMDRDLAVIRFRIEEREAAPYFLKRNTGGWMLDFVSMSQFIGFDHQNRWFFRSGDHPFMFAFDDLTFDRDGYPASLPDENLQDAG